MSPSFPSCTIKLEAFTEVSNVGNGPDWNQIMTPILVLDIEFEVPLPNLKQRYNGVIWVEWNGV